VSGFERAAEAALAVGHVLVAAAWFGAMSYSLFVVQPRAARLLGSDRYEPLAQTLASGQRWKVLGLMAGLALSGGLLLAVLVGGDDGSSSGDAGGRDAGWWWVLAVHAGLLALALVVFLRVSWRLWPARVFALPAELEAVRRRFTMAALTLLGTVGTATALGVLAQVLRTAGT
jgi:hypothetical protein